MRNLYLFVMLVLLSAACKTTQKASSATPASAAQSSYQAVEEQHDNLNAVLWVQTSAEYTALCKQAYLSAQLALDEALDDPSWTASTEQEEMGNFAELPPAVILDVDETVLDNSPFQARLIQTGQTYTSKGWALWTSEEAAKAIPGALDYTKEAADRGITVFYVTNRKAPEEKATLNNLRKLGFPIADNLDVILTKGERDEWSSSNKTPRREFLAKQYRILQMVGDNLGDFIEAEASLDQRLSAVQRYSQYWGMQWIVLPNPTYGNWESALFERDYSKSATQQRKDKLNALRN